MTSVQSAVAITPMTASDVRSALDTHWPASSYVSIDEAPTSADRQGTKLDRLVCSLWRSRGYELDGVEIKVSMSDWQRELLNPIKADWWWRHVHRFWLAVPEKIALNVKETLPTGWGLLACSPQACRVIVKPAKHEALSLPWTSVLGLLRSAGDCGSNALRRAGARGRVVGREQAVAEFQRSDAEVLAQRDLQDLRERVEAFERESGITISAAWRISDTAKAASLMRRLMLCRDNMSVQQFKTYADRLRVFADNFEMLAADATELLAADPN